MIKVVKAGTIVILRFSGFTVCPFFTEYMLICRNGTLSIHRIKLRARVFTSLGSEFQNVRRAEPFTVLSVLKSLDFCRRLVEFSSSIINRSIKNSGEPFLNVQNEPHIPSQSCARAFMFLGDVL